MTIMNVVSAKQNKELWAVLALLLAAVLVPTACVLWFMTQAMENEQLAMRQRLVEIHEQLLENACGDSHVYWREKFLFFYQGYAPSNGLAENYFAHVVRKGICDSLVEFYYGNAPYPRLKAAPSVANADIWRMARALEFTANDPASASRQYADIALSEVDDATKARALLYQARCLVKSADIEAALKVLTGALREMATSELPDADVLSTVLRGQLRALELMGSPSHPGFDATRRMLEERLNDYLAPTLDLSTSQSRMMSRKLLSSQQRRFLMRRVQELTEDDTVFDTLAAEDLAAAYLESNSGLPSRQTLRKTALEGVWQVSVAHVTALYIEDAFIAELEERANIGSGLGSATLHLSRPGDVLPDDVMRRGVTYGYMAGWQWYVDVDEGVDLTMANIKWAYLWAAGLTILAITLIASATAGYILRAQKVTRLKNTLIATVSHELKTPLSSMRVLVDTLIDDRCRDEVQRKEYLALIAKENTRLSRLIDNFLTFSRMERNKHVFEFRQLNMGDVLHEAVESVRERFEASGCRFEIEVEEGLPDVTGDRDALATVVINLLDNAWKYSTDERHICLRAKAADGKVKIEVEDNGVGLPVRARKKIFERFYQVDQSLTRGAGGCGLGLSIVQFIVAAHGGTVEVRSELGRGSVFTVALPAENGGKGPS